MIGSKTLCTYCIGSGWEGSFNLTKFPTYVVGLVVSYQLEDLSFSTLHLQGANCSYKS